MTVIGPSGSFELRYERLTLKQVKELNSAGISSEFRTRRANLSLDGFFAEDWELPKSADESVIGSLHFRAYRFLKEDGYVPEDIAGFVELSEEELVVRQPEFVSLLKEDGRWYAAEYFFKSGSSVTRGCKK